MIALVLLAVGSTASLVGLELLRDSALPLSGKRVMLTPPRTEAAPLTSALVLAGCQPIWCPGVSIEPLEDYGVLDDALMRLTEYDIIVLHSCHAIDAVAQRWLSLADGSTDVVQAMLDASSIELGAVGGDALYLRKRLGVSASVVPIEQSSRALADTLRELGHVKPGARVLLCCGESAGAPIDDPPASVATCLLQLRNDGAEVDRVATHRIIPCGAENVSPPEADLAVLRADGTTPLLDALCVGSAEELRAIVAAAAAGGDHAVRLPGVLVALGDESAACARELAPDGAEIIELGARPSEAQVVHALEEHFGKGKLLW